jgi:hypothetical protein
MIKKALLFNIRILIEGLQLFIHYSSAESIE